MLRALLRAPIVLSLLFIAPAARSEDRDLSAALQRLETGDWNTRMRTVHELEYMQSTGIPGLGAAAQDGDWQVRMSAVQALGAAGPDATPILKSILKNEPCPVVRLIALHNLGSQATDGEEKLAIDWMLSASESQVNNCRDQPEPGLAGWAKRPRKRAPETPVAAAPFNPHALPNSEAQTEPSDERVITPDVPKTVRVHPAPKAAAPTKNERYAELDALLAEPSGTEETLGGAPSIGRRPSPPPEKPASATLSRTNENAALSRRRTAAPESLPQPVVTMPAEGRPDEAPAAFEAAGGKAPHDAIPDLILALKTGSVRARSRAADELGYSGAAAGAAVPALMTALKDKSPRVRASASLALGNIGAAAGGVVPLLVKALKDKSLDVRYAATLALSRIRTPAARKAFKKYIGEDARRAIERQQP